MMALVQLSIYYFFVILGTKFTSGGLTKIKLPFNHSVVKGPPATMSNSLSKLESEHSRTSCSECKASQISPLRCASVDALAGPEQRQLLRYLPGQVVFLEGQLGNGIHCIQSGVIALERAGTNGVNSIVGLRQSGDTLGYRAFVTNDPQSHSAVATTECVVCHLDRSFLKKFLGADPACAQRFIYQKFDQMDEAEMLFVKSRMLSVRGRLANVLLALKGRHATADETGCLTFELPFSRLILASLVGARPETLSRAIRALEHAEVARFNGRTVVVPDLDDLLDETEHK